MSLGGITKIDDGSTLLEVCENPVFCNVALDYNPEPGELKFGRGVTSPARS
jgi:hypothetical protein